MPPLFYEEKTMPIHEFICKSCNSAFELLLMSKAEITSVRCPRCQSPDVQRLMSAPNATVTDGDRNQAAQPAQTIQQRSCGSGSCASFELSGHNK